jgi:hypothetical protein
LTLIPKAKVLRFGYRDKAAFAEVLSGSVPGNLVKVSTLSPEK